MTLPPDTPYWLVLLALFVGWLGANVWPTIRVALTARMGTNTDILRARAEAELAKAEREIKAEEDQANAERQIAEALLKLAQLVEVNIAETRESKHVLASLTTAFSAQIGMTPTLRDIQQMIERISAIETHLAIQNPAWFGRRVDDAQRGKHD